MLVLVNKEPEKKPAVNAKHSLRPSARLLSSAPSRLRSLIYPAQRPLNSRKGLKELDFAKHMLCLPGLRYR